jgi:hypothetical protein
MSCRFFVCCRFATARYLTRDFASARQFAGGILALDDGSTDDTPALLHAESMVQGILQNPQRTEYAGWNDAVNRQRLLDAATARRLENLPKSTRLRLITWLSEKSRIGPVYRALMRSQPPPSA